MIPKEAIEAFYSKADVQSTGTILNIESALTAAFAAMSEPVAWVRHGAIEELHKDGSHIGVTSTLWLNEIDEGKKHSKRIPLYAAPQPVSTHPDDLAVDRFATVMKAKLSHKRAEGRGGWDNPDECSVGWLSELLRRHVDKGDPIDVGNFAMMIHQRGGTIK